MENQITDLAKQRIIPFSGGKQLVSIGDRFSWEGMIHEVVEFVSNNYIYSPSGLGGTIGIKVKNETGYIDEWCADSVANGIHYNKI